MNESQVPDPAAPAPLPRWITLVVCLAAALLVYLPVLLHAQFLNFDDPFFFGPDNEAFRNGGLAAILDPRRTIANVYLPVSHLSLYLDYLVFGQDPLGAHLVSLVLHALCGVALVRWLLAMGVRALPAHAVGLLFLLHPALCESVAWVSGRKDVLAGLFTFLALGTTARTAFRPTLWRFVAIAGLGVLAMYSKATAVVLPLLSLLVCVYLRGTDRRRFVAPLVLLMVTAPIAFHHQQLAAAEGTLVTGSAAPGMRQVPGALWHYLTTMFAPVHLNVLYPEVSTFERFRDLLVPGLLALAVLLVTGHLLWRSRWRPAALGILVLLVALLPFNTVLPAMKVPAADRYLYLAVPGAALLLASLGRAGIVLGFLLVLPLGWLCHQRSEVFASSDALWRASLLADPHNTVACLNLAQDLQRRQQTGAEWRELLDRAAADARYPQHEWRAQRELLRLALAEGRYEAAVQHAEQALAALAKLPEGKATRAARLAGLIDLFEMQRLCGRAAAAAQTLATAETLAPDDPAVVAMRCQVWLQEAVAAAAAGPGAVAVADHPRSKQADLVLQQALQRLPDDPLLNRIAGAWEYARDHRLAALKYFKHMIEVAPLDVEGWVSAAQVCQDSELYEDAEQFARQGLLRRPAEPRLRQLLALALAAQNRLDDAIVHLEAYVAVRPRDRDAARVLSNLLVGKAQAGFGDKSHAELEALIERALRWNPDEPKVDIVRGRMCREKRQWQQAIVHLERAARRFPGLEDVVRMLAESYRDLGYELWGFSGKGERDRDGAVDAWLQFLQVAPSDLPTEAVRIVLQGEWRRLEVEGLGFLEQQQRDQAAGSLRRCLRIGESFAMAGDKTHAEVDDLIGRALRSRPDQPDVDLLCGAIYRDQHQWRQAVLRLQAAAERFPGQEEIVRMLADSYRDLGGELWGLTGKEPPDRDGAVDSWLKFLQLVPAGEGADTVRILLQREWKRLAALGIDLLEQGQRDAAEGCFRRCLLVDPANYLGACLLAETAFGKPGADWQEIDRLLQQAVTGKRKLGLDPSKQVLLRVQNLQQAGRADEALQIGREFLAAPGPDADAAVLERLRKAIGS